MIIKKEKVTKPTNQPIKLTKESVLEKANQSKKESYKNLTKRFTTKTKEMAFAIIIIMEKSIYLTTKL